MRDSRCAWRGRAALSRYLARAISAAAIRTVFIVLPFSPLRRCASIAESGARSLGAVRFIYRDDTPSTRSTGGDCVSGYCASKCITPLITRPPPSPSRKILGQFHASNNFVSLTNLGAFLARVDFSGGLVFSHPSIEIHTCIHTHTYTCGACSQCANGIRKN